MHETSMLIHSEPFTLKVLLERFPIEGNFVISRGSKREAVVVIAQVEAGGVCGRGECVPYARYQETSETVMGLIESLRSKIEKVQHPSEVLNFMPAGAARNAVDCALWDWFSRKTGTPCYQSLSLPAPQPVTTAFTISLGSPEAMAEAARKNQHRPLLKIKLGTENDHERIRAVREAAPKSRLVVDANEGWTPSNLLAHFQTCFDHQVALIEQPLPEGKDEVLNTVPHLVPLCADESIHDGSEIESLVGRYEAVNIKLDKTGGLTQAVATLKRAKALQMQVMVGCMVGTSLGMAPALLLASEAEFVDLDGPLLLAQDRSPGLRYEGSLVYPSSSEVWGGP